MLQVNGKPVKLKYLGYEIEQEAIWCYMEVVKLPKIHSIHITNDILFKEHESQVNLLHVSVGGQRKSTKLDNPSGLASFKF
ncbi:DUF6702 family protein [Pedobacter sp. SYSU D00535]|uniref:DUF6702 family protein n=1 Tax=Pedobacter sp. SYSU D00535 TaxID=2810308 RepID=UPI001A956420|nr:DUF6702 family protein [Pedobacter sp. SYSU D00535]